MTEKATRREWAGLAVLALPTLLAAMDFSVLFLALPRLAADLAPDSTQLLWITDIYGFMVAGFLVTMGAVGDRFGRRRLLMTGAAAFGALSVLAAYAPTPGMLIAARALLGVSGATLMPSTLALISNMFRDPRQRTSAISLWATCLLVGTVLGPVVGGLLLEFFWWGSAFLMGVPVMVLLLIIAPRLLPEHRTAAAGRPDLRSVALSLATVLPLVYGLKELANGGPEAPALAALAGGAGSGILFARRQRHLRDPLFDLGLFRSRSFSAALAVLLAGAVVSGGAALLFSQYLQLVRGLPPLRAGLWLIPDTAGMITASLLAPVLARRVRPRLVIAGGLVICACGFGVLSQVGPVSALGWAVTGVVLIFFGVAPTWVLGTDLVVGAVAPQRAGSASALSETTSELGVALGVALIGSLSTAIYRGRLAETMPAHLPAPVALPAQDSLAGAVAAAPQLPASAATALLDAARGAFTSGLAVSATVSAALAVGLAVAFVVPPRRARVNPGTTDGARGTGVGVTGEPAMLPAGSR